MQCCVPRKEAGVCGYQPLTVASRVDELASDLQIQLKAKAKEFVSYWLAADESTDRTDSAQLSIFIRGVDAKFAVNEELLDLKSTYHGLSHIGRKVKHEKSFRK